MFDPYENENDERLCHCNECRYCRAFLSSDYDYDDQPSEEE